MKARQKVNIPITDTLKDGMEKRDFVQVIFVFHSQPCNKTILVYSKYFTRFIGEKSWWQKIDRNDQTKTEDKTEKLKDMLDPLSSVRKYLGTEGVKSVVKKSKHKEIEYDKHSKHKKSKKKHKKEKKSKKGKSKKKSRRKSSESSDSEDDLERVRKQQKLEKLRQERLNRETKERAKANHVLYGIPIEEKAAKGSKKDGSKEGERKYNSQFNPHLAKQNKLDAKEKYWLK